MTKGGFTFDAEVLGTTATVELQVPGKHNVLNALAALTVVKLLNLSPRKSRAGAGSIHRHRTPVRGPRRSTPVSSSLMTTRTIRPKSRPRWQRPGTAIRIDASGLLQPHTYSRTQMLFDGFVRSFSDADEVIVTEVYAALRTETGFFVQANRGCHAPAGAFHRRFIGSKQLSGCTSLSR